METTRDVIQEEVDKKLLPVEVQQRTELLPLDERKGKNLYFKGPPEMVYVRLLSGAAMRVALVDSGILSNEVQTNPERFRVRIQGPYYKLPMDPIEVVTYGELVRVPDIVKGDKDMAPTISNPILGHAESSQTVKSMEVGDSSIKVGDKGDVQIISKGEAVKTFTDGVEISKRPEDTTVMFGGDKKTLFNNSFLGEILPKSFFPPMNTPNWTVSGSIFERAQKILNEAIDIATAIKKNVK